MARTKHVKVAAFKAGDVIWKGMGTCKVLVLDNRVTCSMDTIYRVCPLNRRHVQKLVTPKELEVLGYYKHESIDLKGIDDKKKRKKEYGVDKVNNQIAKLKKTAQRTRRK